MSSDLVNRMRTCAAAISASDNLPLLHRDAADLLLEASNLLDVPEPLGEPMEIIEPLPPKPQEGPTWMTGDMIMPSVMNLGNHHPKACPKCSTIAAHTVHRKHRSLELQCRACGHRWEWRP